MALSCADCHLEHDHRELPNPADGDRPDEGTCARCGGPLVEDDGARPDPVGRANEFFGRAIRRAAGLWGVSLEETLVTMAPPPGEPSRGPGGRN